MNPRTSILALGLAMVALASWPRRPLAAAGAARPVVVELVTSQGCSSCPPADRLLSALGGEPDVVALSVHVDYWNSLGWSDPFSRPEWSRRQEGYARALGERGVYTPQAVIDGSAELVGSDAAALRAAIARAADQPAAKVSLALLPGAGDVRANVTVEVPPELRDRALTLWVALCETGLETAVGRGENGGRSLHNDYVVRGLDRAGHRAAAASGPWRESLRLALDPAWKAGELRIAAFVQDDATLAIRGAAKAPLPTTPGLGPR
jgi:hypothetical protein